MNQRKLTLLAASAFLGLATMSTASFAQVTPGGAGERHANEAPGLGTKAANPKPAPKTGPSATTGSQTKTDPATIGTSGRDKQTGAPKDKD